MIYTAYNGRKVKIVTNLLAMLNYDKYYGSDFILDMEIAMEEKKYTNIIKCVSACYVSPKTQKLNEESIEEFIEDPELMGIIMSEPEFMEKFSNAFAGSSSDKGKRKGKNNRK